MRQIMGKVAFCEVLYRAIRAINGYEVSSDVAEAVHDTVLSNSNSLIGSALFAGLKEMADTHPPVGPVKDLDDLLRQVDGLDGEINLVLPTSMMRYVFSGSAFNPSEKYQAVMDGCLGQMGEYQVHTTAFTQPDAYTRDNRVYVLQVHRDRLAPAYQISWYKYAPGA